jgi:signal transduction histidine kinase
MWCRVLKGIQIETMDEHYLTPAHCTILLVDDAPNNLRLLSSMLEEHGYEVRTVTSGKSALTSVRTEAPDLLLLDIAMPEMNGYEVCEQLQADPQTRDIPVIFISALHDALDKVRAFEAGGVDYISKPFHVQEVLARVRTHLALRSAQRQLVQQNQQLQSLSHRLVDVQEQERRAIARELHDEVGQILTGLNLSLEVVGHAPTDEQRTARLENAQQMVTELIQYVREMSMQLRPPMLDDLGVLPALFWHFERYTAQTGIEVRCQHTGIERRFAPEVEVTIYRIIQEALTNIARHASVTHAIVRLWAHNAHLTIQVQDQGEGFRPAETRATSASSGLAGIHERARLLGGHVDIESAPGQGTQLTVELPLTLPADASRHDMAG